MKRSFACFTVCLLCSVFVVGALANGEKKHDPVRDFVSGIYEHGVPYKEAHSLGRRALPELESMLKDEAYKPYWQTIAATICYIGEPNSFQGLKDFMLNRFKGEIDSPTFSAMMAIMTSLGPLAAKSNPAFEFLVKGTDPAFWSAIPWSHEHHKGSYLRELWSEQSINALGLSGRREAIPVLERLAREPFDKRQLGNIEEGLGTQREVEAVGIEGYFDRHRGRDTSK